MNAAVVLYVDQCDDAHGSMQVQMGAQVNVASEPSVVVAGPGTWEQMGNTVTVGGWFIVGRYNVAAAIGSTVLSRGTLQADRFDTNYYSTLRLEGCILILDGDDMSKANKLILAGRLTSDESTGTNADYNPKANQTYISGTSKVSVYNYYDNVQSSWSVKDQWQRNVVIQQIRGGMAQYYRHVPEHRTERCVRAQEVRRRQVGQLSPRVLGGAEGQYKL